MTCIIELLGDNVDKRTRGLLTYQGCEQDYDAAETEDFIRQEFLDLAINSDRPVAVRDAANALVDEASENIRKYAQRLEAGLKMVAETGLPEIIDHGRGLVRRLREVIDGEGEHCNMKHYCGPFTLGAIFAVMKDTENDCGKGSRDNSEEDNEEELEETEDHLDKQ